MNEINNPRRHGRIYDYNYKVGEGYYKPQSRFMSEEREKVSPPKHQTYAERFASNPIYGGAHGLPYDSKRSAYNEPVAKASFPPRSSSLVREIQELEKDDIPLHIRANRRKKKFEREEAMKGVRPKIGTQLSLTNTFPTRSALRMEELQQDINNLGDGLDIRPRRQPFSYQTSTYNDRSNIPGRTSVKREVERHYGPGLSSHTISHRDVSNYQSSGLSRPPLAPRARKISFGSDVSSYGIRARNRPNLDDTSFRRARSASITGEDSLISFNRAQKLRDEKRKMESHDMAQSIHNVLDQMRTRNVDPEAAYTYTRSNRLSSYDPPSRKGSQKRPHGYSTSKQNV